MSLTVTLPESLLDSKCSFNFKLLIFFGVVIALETRVKPHRSVGCVFMRVLSCEGCSVLLNESVKRFQQRALRLLVPAAVVSLRMCAGGAEKVPVSKTCASPLSSDAFVDCHKRGDADETDQLLPALEETIL